MAILSPVSRSRLDGANPGNLRSPGFPAEGFGLAQPAAAQVAVGGVMRFATTEVAFNGGFGGAAVDVWLLEPYGYLSYDAGVWAIQAGVAAPVVRRETVRVALHVGTSTAVAGPQSRVVSQYDFPTP